MRGEVLIEEGFLERQQISDLREERRERKRARGKYGYQNRRS